MQMELDHISLWATHNHMKLNPKKRKELRVSFLHDPFVILQVNVSGIPIEVVRNHKVQGIYIYIRLYIIRILKCNGPPSGDLVNIYFVLVRAVLEYDVWCGILIVQPIWPRRLNGSRSDAFV